MNKFIKKTEPNLRIKKSGCSPEKLCKNNEEYVTVSFLYFTQSKKFGFSEIKDHKHLYGLLKGIQLLSEKKWNDLLMEDRKGSGVEKIPLGCLNIKFANSLRNVTPEERIYVIRFNGTNNRLFLKRGRSSNGECSNIAYILGLENKLGDVYKHS